MIKRYFSTFFLFAIAATPFFHSARVHAYNEIVTADSARQLLIAFFQNELENVQKDSSGNLTVVFSGMNTDQRGGETYFRLRLFYRPSINSNPSVVTIRLNTLQPQQNETYFDLVSDDAHEYMAYSGSNSAGEQQLALSRINAVDSSQTIALTRNTDGSINVSLANPRTPRDPAFDKITAGRLLPGTPDTLALSTSDLCDKLLTATE